MESGGASSHEQDSSSDLTVAPASKLKCCVETCGISLAKRAKKDRIMRDGNMYCRKCYLVTKSPSQKMESRGASSHEQDSSSDLTVSPASKLKCCVETCGISLAKRAKKDRIMRDGNMYCRKCYLVTKSPSQKMESRGASSHEQDSSSDLTVSPASKLKCCVETCGISLAKRAKKDRIMRDGNMYCRKCYLVTKSPSQCMDDGLRITTCDLHTAGHPVRIVETGYPPLVGNTILEKRHYALASLDKYRKLLMLEPRGHNEMYGAILTEPSNPEADIGVVFTHNEGYSPMCGHAIIALGRYAVDKKLVRPKSPETQVNFECPCGIVKAHVECTNSRGGRVRFHSVPSFVYKLDAKISVKNLGNITFDIAYGGAFYAIFNVSQFDIDLHKASLSTLMELGHEITETASNDYPLQHPDSADLAYFYGTILTDGKDAFSEFPTSNVCVFGGKQVDRSPTGSGVSARIALMYKRNQIALDQQREFNSIVNTRMTGKAIKETKCGDHDAVVVEVTGMAHYTGNHSFVLEDSDPLPLGLQLL